MTFPPTYIYAGPGAGQSSVRALERSLRAFGIYRVDRLGWREVNSLASTGLAPNALLCMPGGRDLPLVNRFRPQAIRAIKRFVERGGTYLGICSGAYFASASLDFAPATPYCVTGERPLRFFGGLARGPTHDVGAFSYRSSTTGRLVPIRAHFGEVHAYTLGGCALVQADARGADAPSFDSHILARYGPEAKHEPAARLQKVGRGHALLIGLHLEWEAEDLATSAGRRALGRELEATRAMRARLFESWLRRALFN